MATPTAPKSIIETINIVCAHHYIQAAALGSPKAKYRTENPDILDRFFTVWCQKDVNRAAHRESFDVPTLPSAGASKNTSKPTSKTTSKVKDSVPGARTPRPYSAVVAVPRA